MDISAATLRTLAETLLDDTASAHRIRDAVNRMFDGLSAQIGFDDRAPTDAELGDTWVDGGRAISPREAARCLREHLRTAKFLRGVQAAIAAARARFPGERIHVLYAGCGPFATLVLPLAHRWPADQVHYTLIDMHRHSLDAARRVADFLGVADRVTAWERADAIHYRCDPADAPHIVVTETMLRALADEPQVAICRNLVPQQRPGGLLVPERIELIASWVDPGVAFFDEPRLRCPPVDLGVVMELDAASAAQGGRCLAIDWPAQRPAGTTPMLRTRITVFGGIVLGDKECSLNLPVALPLPDGDAVGGRIAYRYVQRPRPGLQAEWVGPSHAPVRRAVATDSGLGHLKLPLRFDPAPLQAELAALADRAWTRHPNTGDYDGDWRALALRSLSGEEADGSTCSERPEAYRDTAALHRSPALAAVLASLPGTPTSARLLSLMPGSRILEHRDRGTQLFDGLVRLHVPIRTDPRVDFRVDGERLDMRPGECWYLNANHAHSVHNAADVERVHLVVDCVVDEADVARFVAWGHPPPPARPFDDPSVTAENVAAVIAQFEAMGNAVGQGFAARLRSQAAAAGIAVPSVQ